MATLNATIGFSVSIGTGPSISDGSTAIPVPITVNNFNGGFEGSLAAAAILVLWNTANAPVSTFVVGWVIADQVCVIELQAGSAAANSNLQLIANVLWPIPGTGLAYNASGGFAGTSTAISKVTVKNTSGSTANIRARFF